MKAQVVAPLRKGFVVSSNMYAFNALAYCYVVTQTDILQNYLLVSLRRVPWVRGNESGGLRTCTHMHTTGTYVVS